MRAGALMRILMALETNEGWRFQAKHARGVEIRLADKRTRWKGEEIQNNLTKRSAPNCLAGAKAGEGGAADVFGDFARGYALGWATASTRNN